MGVLLGFLASRVGLIAAVTAHSVFDGGVFLSNVLQERLLKRRPLPWHGSVLNVVLQVLERIGGPGRDRTDDLFHAMEARSQLRHRPTCEDTNVLPRITSFILAHPVEIVNALSPC